MEANYTGLLKEQTEESTLLREIVQKIFFFALPTICVLGLFGNTLGVTLLQGNHSLRKLASGAYLLLLTVCSSVFLIIVFLQWLEPIIGLPIYKVSNIGCKLNSYLLQVSDSTCTWLISVLALDRFLLLCAPHKRAKLIAGKLVEAICAGTVTVQLLVNIWILILSTLVSYQMPNNVTITFCSPDPEYTQLSENLLIVSIVIGIVLPSITTVICTFGAVIKLWHHSKYRPAMLQGHSVRFGTFSSTFKPRFSQQKSLYRFDSKEKRNRNTRDGSLPLPICTDGEQTKRKYRFSLDSCKHWKKTRKSAGSTKSGSLEDRGALVVSVQHSPHAQPTSKLLAVPKPEAEGASTSSANASSEFKYRKSEISMTRTLLLTLCVFLVTVLPSYSLRLWMFFFDSEATGVAVMICKAIITLLYYSHHAVLSYVYIFSSPQMRKLIRPTAMQALECRCFDPVHFIPQGHLA